MRLVIIGGGVAGVTTARLVAEKAPSTEIVIYSRERYLYYPRPRLIDVVAGEKSPGQIVSYSEDWYRKRGIRLMLGRLVAEIRPKAREIVLDYGTVDRYDRLVLATGAHSWVPPISGTDLNVFTLREMGDALALCDQANRVRHAVVLGGGLLGLDTAAALCAHEIGVTVVEMLPRLLPRQLDAEGANLIQTLIERLGIKVITGDLCTGIEGTDRVKRIQLKSGRVVETEMIVISAGVRPNVGLAQSAGLICDRAVVVDECMRTSYPDIYAVGDAAEFGGRTWCIIPVALAQARVAAAQITGDTAAIYKEVVPSTTLKVTGIDLTSLGEVNPEGKGFTEVRQADLAKGVYKKLVVRDGLIVGAIVIGDRPAARAISQLISRRIDVSGQMHALLTEGFDLIDYARERLRTS